MEIADIRKLELDDISKLVDEHNKKVAELKFKMVNSESVNSSEIKKARKTVARLLTVANERRAKR